MKSVLIISTCYDATSHCMSQWAMRLRNSLLAQPNTICLHYEAAELSSNPMALQGLVDRVDFVVFYGHGTQNEWIALPELATSLPPVSATPLVDVNTVGVFRGKKIYAGCCWSLQGLGQAHVANANNAEFIGYVHEFDFDYSNASSFEEVVNQSVLSYINGASAARVAQNLKVEWSSLRDRFRDGFLQSRPNAQTAMAAAERNSKRVGALP